MADKSAGQDNGSLSKAVVGIILGMALTILYIRYGWTPPVFLQLLDVIELFPDTVIAESTLSDPSASFVQQQRAIITLIKHDEELFKEIDNEVGFTRLVISKRVDRKISLLKVEMSKYHIIEEQPAVADSIRERYGGDDWKKGWLARRISKDEFLSYHLQRRFPQLSIDEIAEKLLADSH